MINENNRRYHPQGLRILYYVLKEKSWKILVENEILDDDFFSESKICLKFIKNFIKDHKDFPPIDVVESLAKIKFPQEAVKSFCIEDFNNYKVSCKIKEMMLSVKDLAISDPKKCLIELKNSINNIEYANSINSFKTTAKEFFLDYKAEKTKEAQGIVPAYPCMQENFEVYENGTFNAILGVTGSGKTWISCVTALYAAFNQGKKVLFISMENPKKSIIQRTTSLYHKIPFGSLKRGLVDMRTEKYWEERLPSVEEERGDIWVIDNSIIRTVDDILHHVSSINPDFVLIDGAYKLTSRGSGNGYEKSSQVLQNLDDAAKVTNIPFLGSSQLNRDAQTAKGGRDIGFEARFNKEWLMNPATVCCLTQTDDDLKFNRVKCTIAKNRDSGDTQGVEQEFVINEDKILMNFTQQTDQFLDDGLLNSTLYG